MANTYFSGTVYIDTAAAAATTVPVKVAYIVFRAAAANDAFKLTDGSGGAIKFTATMVAAKDTQIFDFSRRPIVFNASVYCSVLTSGAEVTLYTTTESAGS